MFLEEQLPQLERLSFMASLLYSNPYLEARAASLRGRYSLASHLSVSVCSGETGAAVPKAAFCLAITDNTHFFFDSRKRIPAEYGTRYGTVTVTPRTGCTLTDTLLLLAFLRRTISPMSSSLYIFSSIPPAKLGTLCAFTNFKCIFVPVPSGKGHAASDFPEYVTIIYLIQ